MGMEYPSISHSFLVMSFFGPHSDREAVGTKFQVTKAFVGPVSKEDVDGMTGELQSHPNLKRTNIIRQAV
jgi:hypothetical protein